MLKSEREKFEAFLRYNESLADLHKLHLDFSKFETNKARLVEKLGGYIHRTPIELGLEVSDEDWKRVMIEYQETLISVLSSQEIDVSALILFLGDNGLEGFKINKVLTSSFQEVKPGMKLTKAIKSFLPDNHHWIDWAQTLYSKVTNSVQKMTGYLHISVHPIDFITMSESGYSWRSCQSMDGDYAAGTLSLMSDGATMVAYVTNEHQDFIGVRNLEWWPKKWRALVHVNPAGDKILINKHYPSYSITNEKLLMSKLSEIWSEHDFTYVTGIKQHIRNHQIAMADIVTFVKNKIFYNDLNTDADPAVLYAGDLKQSDKIFIGASVKCVHCGEQLITEGLSFSCDNCHDNFIPCDGCGDLFEPEELEYEPEHGSICHSCSLEYAREREIGIR